MLNLAKKNVLAAEKVSILRLLLSFTSWAHTTL